VIDYGLQLRCDCVDVGVDGW